MVLEELVGVVYLLWNLFKKKMIYHPIVFQNSTMLEIRCF